jgi:phosphoribosyl-ATP pyrophosphohydrolase
MEEKMRFKPKMKDVIAEFGMDPVILVPKNGGLKDIVVKTLKAMGVDYLSFDKIDRDNYTDGELTVSIYRGEDIPGVVEDLYFTKGVKAIGLTGDDLYDEYLLRTPLSLVSVLETVEWDDETATFRRPALCWMTREGETPTGKTRIAVNRKYEQTSRRAIDEIKDDLGIEPVITVYSGNTEQTVADSINDLVVEIVYTGTSVTRNKLDLKDKIRCSDFDLIGVNESDPVIFLREYQQMTNRVQNPKPDSYTSELASDQNRTIKKIGEETAEFIAALMEYQATKDPAKRQALIGEFCDKFYTAMIAMAANGIGFKEMTAKIYRRFKRD